MKITIESTEKIVTIIVNGAEVPARIWEGATGSGIPVHAYLTRIAAFSENTDLSQFERELQQCRAPSAAVAAIPLRLIL